MIWSTKLRSITQQSDNYHASIRCAEEFSIRILSSIICSFTIFQKENIRDFAHSIFYISVTKKILFNFIQLYM